MMKFSRSRPSGFTLLELLAVLTILAIVMGVVAPAIMNKVKQGRVKASQVQLNGLETSLNAFNLDCGFYPMTEQGLAALKIAPTVGKLCKGYEADGYWQKPIPDDPWKHPYVYVSPGQHNATSFDLSSPGPDGVEGNEDDIKNWE